MTAARDLLVSPWPLSTASPLRWDASPDAWLPDPQALVSATHNTPSHPQLDAALAPLGVPVADLRATPLVERAALLGLDAGCTFTHHELRGRIAMPPDLAPEVDVWDQGTTPTWSGGVLEEPKYFSFFQDAPLPSYNPNHRRKWRAHELLHSAVGFFWRPDMSRFGAYAAARLGELLPVAHWYGWDEIGRARCALHRGQPPERVTCPDCELLAATPLHQASPHDLPEPEDDLRRAHEAAAHFSEEWAVILRELERGRPIASPRGALDASSDAIGYMLGHWNRTTAWSFGAWVERFLVAGEDYADNLPDYALRVAQTTARLLTGSLEVDLARAARLRARRALLDAGYRTTLALEWLEHSQDAPAFVEEQLWEALDMCASAAHALREPDAAPALLQAPLDALDGAFTRGKRWWPEQLAASFPALGHDLWRDRAHGATDALREGLEGVSPSTAALLDEAQPSWVDDLATHPTFTQGDLLAARLSLWADATQSPLIAQLAALEAWIARGAGRDEQGELFGGLPQTLEAVRAGELWLNATARQAGWPADAVALVIGAEAVEGLGDEVTLLAARMRGEVRMAAIDEAVGQVLEVVRAGGAPDPDAADEELSQAWWALLEAGLIFWSPRGV